MQSKFQNEQVRRAFPGAYEIDAACLRSFEILLARHLGTAPVCSLQFKNGRGSEVHSVDELLEDSFLQNASIKSISFSGRNETLKAQLDFEASFWAPVAYRLSGQRNAVIGLETEIENLIQRPRRWYGWLLAPFGQNVATGTFVYLLGLATLVVIAFQIGAANGSTVPNPRLTLAAVGTLLACLGWFLLPPMVFSVGRGERRAAALKKFASFLMIGVGTASIVNWGTALYNPFQP